MPVRATTARRVNDPLRKRQVVRPVGHEPPEPGVLQCAIADPGRARPADILALQRAAGNRAVSRHLQAKLTVGPAGDHDEREADRMADRVLALPRPQSTPKAARPAALHREARGKPFAQRQEEVQTKPTRGSEPQEGGGFEAGPAIESRLAASRGTGQPLPDGVRRSMEPRFGADLSGVRVHAGGEAARMNRELRAQAFTHGRDIYVGEGRYDPGSTAGQHLLAHELTHVVQQTGSGRQPIQRQARPIIQRQVMTLDEWTSQSALSGKPRSAALRRVDKAVEQYQKFQSQENLTAILNAAQDWMATKGTGTSKRHEAVARLVNQVLNAQKHLPEPEVNLANVPLGLGDLLKARELVYVAATDALIELAGSATDPAIQQQAAALEAEFSQEALKYRVAPHAKSALAILAGEKKDFKEATKEVFGKGTQAGLAKRIEKALKMKEGQAKSAVAKALIARLNAEGRWRTFVQELDIAGEAYTSQFTPINKEFQETFAERGTTGYASASAKLSRADRDVTERLTATNAWYTQFARGNAPEMEDSKILFAAFRTGTFSEIEGIKKDKDAEARQRQAWWKVRDLLRAMVVEYIRSRETEPERQSILNGTNTPLINVVSTALLTGLPLPLMKKEGPMLAEHHAALEAFHQQQTTFDIVWGGEQKTVKVSFNIINFNKSVNLGRLMGGSRGQQQEINAEAMSRLEQLKTQGLATVAEKWINTNDKLKALPRDDPAYAALKQRSEELKAQMAKIEQLWTRIQAMKGPSGSRYELPALVSNLGYQLGAMVHFNCKSGKDRTGMADVESKLLAYQMDLRTREAVKAGIDVTKAELVPKYEADLKEEEADAAIKLIFEGGNLNIQAMNAGLPGYKVQKALQGKVFTGRLERILATERGRALLQKYMAADEPIKAGADQFTKMLGGFSFLTGS